MIDRKMQRDQGRHTGWRQIFGKIESMAVDDIDRPVTQRSLDPLPMPLVRPMPEIIGELGRKRSRGDQLACYVRSITRDHQRSVTCRYQCPFERREYLLRTTGYVGADRSK